MPLRPLEPTPGAWTPCPRCGAAPYIVYLSLSGHAICLCTRCHENYIHEPEAPAAPAGQATPAVKPPEPGPPQETP